MTDKEFLESLTPIEKELADLYLRRPGLKNNILEIGSGWGLFTRFMMMRSPDTFVCTIDKIPNPQDFKKNTDGYQDRIRQITADSQIFLKPLANKLFDVILIDGDHRYEGFKSDLEQSIRLIKPGGFIFIDDVFHQKNWNGEYGIMKALSEDVLQRKYKITIYPVAHGVAEIETK